MDKLFEINQRYLVEELEPSRKAGRGMYCCPACGSGTGTHGNCTGAVSIRTSSDGKKKAHCFSCENDMDIVDVVGHKEGVDASEAARIVLQRYGSGYHKSSASEDFGSDRQREEHTEPKLPHKKIDYSAYVLACKSAFPGSVAERYVQSRGISVEMARRFCLGYDASSGSGSDGALVIPYDKKGSYYIQRVISPAEGKPHHLKPKNAPGGSGGFLFNEAALYGEDPCFVVESPLCAISIVQCGGKAACALVGTNWNPLKEAIEKRKPTAPLILCLDNDAEKENGSRPGQENQAKLAAYLDGAGVFFTESCVQGEYKDPNEALQKDPKGLTERVILAVEECRNKAATKDSEKQETYRATSMLGYMDSFTQTVLDSRNIASPSTGFHGLDEVLGGGLFPGLYVIGAVSSLGKTAFVSQISDNVAAAGNDVLFFSLEMGRDEMLARSLSRITYDLAKQNGMDPALARTSRGLLDGKRYVNYTHDVLGLIKEAKAFYSEWIAPQMWIFEGFGSLGAADIVEAVEKHIAITGRKPVVVVDYLQILAPMDPKLSDKQNTDRTVLALKRLSRDKGLCVICISSLNRDNYTAPVNMAAFKESGAIEYGSDVLIGIQASGYDMTGGESESKRQQRIADIVKENNDRAKKGLPVPIDVKILKNRSGHKDSVHFELLHRHYHFRELPKGFEPMSVSEKLGSVFDGAEVV